MEKNKVLVVIPAYNEEENIQTVVNEVDKTNSMVDVVVVNDGSKDET